ncbi:MAG: type II toxin-antitoxin system prevent-host-death family antitoxin [Fibrobacteria bacterium]|nr:type II toxin-antitoxin system prevent-host-death family antitoxin [Fibrobacteria bacterium]
MMISINTHEAKTRLSELLLNVESKQETIIICRSGKPVAKLIPCEQAKNPFKTHPKLKNVTFSEDPSLPLSEEDWPAAFK